MKKNAELFKALGDENRLNIIELLSEKEMCVCEVMGILGGSQPAISHHLKILKQAGLVEDRREGKWIFYSLCNDQIIAQLDFLKEVISKNSQALKVSDCSYCEQLRAKMGMKDFE